MASGRYAVHVQAWWLRLADGRVELVGRLRCGSRVVWRRMEAE